MTKFGMLFTDFITILALIINESYSIDVEYYNEENYYDNDSLKIADESDARRAEVNDLSDDNIYRVTTEHSSDTFNENGGEDSVILSYQVKDHKVPLDNTSNIIESATNTLEYTKSYNSILKSVKAKLKTTVDLRTFKEYDYKYDQDEDLCKHLRNKPSNISNEVSKLIYDNDLDKMQYSRFLNLEPAVYFEANTDVDNTKIVENVWYVPQDFPCWDLPFIYGELGTKIKKADVFLANGANLDNVIDTWGKTNSTYKSADPPMSHTMNKWCQVKPCYGDHTLCLFASKRISNICDKKYIIHVPSIMDQVTIVNTINSMRNRIANGLTSTYSHLPTAANMKQVTYDYDLEKIAEAWLRQCLPGSAPCSALDGNIVTQLECMKYMKYCCLEPSKTISRCVPKTECFIHPVIGCLHIWFSDAGKNLIETDINCGRATKSTYNTVQLLWAKTNRIGCAYGDRSNGDVRVVCNFSPGAPFHLDTKLFCGLIAHTDIEDLRNDENITSKEFLASLGIKWNKILKMTRKNSTLSTIEDPQEQIMFATTATKSVWSVDSLIQLYRDGWVGKQFNSRENGTRGMVARLVARFIFIDESESRCDSDEPAYIVGTPGSLCVEKSRTFHALCFDFRDPTPGYRLIAILAPIALFSLILYDLFSSVVRQTVY